MNLYRQSKFTVAFCTSVNPTNYTHPHRKYLTARWVDALACGSVMCGISPSEPSIDQLLWEGATLDFGTIQINKGLQILEAAVHDWKPEQAQKNYRYALERLDWRWRFATIAKICQQYPPRLNAELQLLKQKIEQSPS